MEQPVLCACGFHRILASNATYVKNGVPMCPQWTCAKVKWAQQNDLHRPFYDERPDETED